MTRPQMTSEAKRRSLHVLSLMRSDGLSFTAACRRAATDPRTAHRHVGKQLIRKGGRITTTPYDRIRAEMQMLTHGGKKLVEVRDSRSRSRIGRHAAAVKRAVLTGEWEILHEFRGKSVTSDGVTYEFLTDPDTLERLANAGEVGFEDLYGQVR